MHLNSLLVLLLALFCPFAFAAKTYISLTDIQVFQQVDGEPVEQWPSHTLFTSSEEDTQWVKITGHFPEGLWQPLAPALYVLNDTNIKERVSETTNAPKAVVYQTLKSRQSKARAYKLKEAVQVFNSRQAAEAYWLALQKRGALDAVVQARNDGSSLAKLNSEVPSSDTTATSNRESISELALNLQELANAEEPTSDNSTETSDLSDTRIWAEGHTFTSNYQNNQVIRATGHFPDGQWQPLEQETWLVKPLRLQDRTRPMEFVRPDGAQRFAVIDKVNFEVVVYEVVDGEQSKLVKAPVALGYDRCLSAAKGGKCYYTPEGEYEIEFKLFDADGIRWCVPKKMEAEFKEKLARGERCWRGIMGNHALHFGDSLFLHGTSNPGSIGSRSTHGCVRLRNNDIGLIYRLLQQGDKVLISEQPEQFDLIAMADETDKRHADFAIQTQPAGTEGKKTRITLIEEASEAEIENQF